MKVSLELELVYEVVGFEEKMLWERELVLGVAGFEKREVKELLREKELEVENALLLDRAAAGPILMLLVPLLCVMVMPPPPLWSCTFA